MVRIKLLKGLSYSGIITATKKSPYVTTDEDTAKEAVATGYFELVIDEAASDTSAENTARYQKDDDDDPDDDDNLTPADKEKEQKPISKMTKPELEAYAEKNGIDISSCNNNEERIALIKEVENKQDDDMTADFSQE